LRAYGTNPEIWDGDSNCEHKFNIQEHYSRGQSDKHTSGAIKGLEKQWSEGFCSLCGAWRGELGLEPTFELYINHLMQIFNEVKRVLKPTGTCWVNLGDTYAGSGCGSWNVPPEMKGKHNRKTLQQEDKELYPEPRRILSVPAKSLCCIPDRFKIAMVDSGWICRNEIIWYKKNCMPSSASDRFTVDFEKIYFFSKQGKYYFEQQFEEYKTESIERLDRGISENNKWVNGPDGQTPHNLSQPRENIRKTTKIPQKEAENYGSPRARYHRMPPIGGIKQTEGNGNLTYSGNKPEWTNKGRNMRTVWQINTQPYKEAHFAVFPPELPRRCIQAGCPKDICKKCGKAREKVVEEIKGDWIPIMGRSPDSKKGGKRTRLILERKDKGYSDCGCNAGWDKGVVLDPFMGSGTTALVAKQLGRDYIGIELNENYIKLAEERLSREPDPLF
jgi:DNA modification methylase